MNNLHRELAPITEVAWEQIEDEARRTFKRSIAGRRVVDLVGPAGPTLAAVGTGHLRPLAPPTDGVQVRERLVQPIVELRVPFAVTRDAVDDVERGAQDSDWQPVKDAATEIARAEDRMIFHGWASAGITGIGPSSSNPAQQVPADLADLPDAVAHAMSTLRLAGVDGPYSLLLSAELYTAVAETTVHGYPIRDHIARLMGEGEAIWAPALDGALVVSTRGGDYALHLGQDVSIGYLSHDAAHIQLYLQESLTFLAYTAEASVPLTAAP
ncbi:family 1 encapsulin nanocompartment shell protein [Nakamurella sp.]|uniref:family 1 encapsulin nanocompartment shell protein n=1 Tax=Nakamurella sp. TaxID=1869182 RepID=UPI003784C84F